MNSVDSRHPFLYYSCQVFYLLINISRNDSGLLFIMFFYIENATVFNINPSNFLMHLLNNRGILLNYMSVSQINPLYSNEIVD